MYWLINCLLNFYGFIFGCHHSNLSRVFTIGGDTYVVCCLCGDKFPYSLDSMSLYSYKRKTPSTRISRTRIEWRRSPDFIKPTSNR
jgi:hypothetical protein